MFEVGAHGCSQAMIISSEARVPEGHYNAVLSSHQEKKRGFLAPNPARGGSPHGKSGTGRGNDKRLFHLGWVNLTPRGCGIILIHPVSVSDAES